jgi:hypothetical protein
MRKSQVLVGVIGSSVAFGTLAATSPFDMKSSGVIDVAVFGDSPYGVDAPFGGKTTDTSQLQATPAFVDFINADPSVSLILHVGDIHSGKQNCTLGYDHVQPVVSGENRVGLSSRLSCLVISGSAVSRKAVQRASE